MRKRCIAAAFILSVPALFLSVTANAEDNIRIFINDSEITSDVPPVIEDGRTLVPIRVISEKLNCSVEWLGGENTVEIKKDNTVMRLPIGGETYTVNDITISSGVPAKIINDRTFVPIRLVAENLDCTAVWDENERAVYVAEYPKYEDNFDVLYKLNIINEEDVNSGEYITVRDAPKTLIEKNSFTDLRGWYLNDALASFDDIDDSDKSLLLIISQGNAQKISEINLDANFTNYDALKYITRTIADTYGCTDVAEEIGFTEVQQTYDRAYEKGLIDKIDIDSSNLPIKRADYYKLINKSLFIEYWSGGYVTQKTTRAKLMFSQIENEKHKAKPKQPIVHQISVDYTINEDMSVSWTTPDEYKDVITDDSHIEVGLYTEDNEKIGGYMSIGIRTELSPEWLIPWLLKNQTKKAAYLKVRYYNYNMKTNSTDEEWYFDIAMPDIEILFEGEEVKPGTFTAFNREWVPKAITLADGQTFKKGSYYMITSYSHNSRKEEYNHVSSAIWKADEDTEIFDNSDHHRNLNCGGLSLDDMHIQKITVNGNATSGFKLIVTPESTDIFKVE